MLREGSDCSPHGAQRNAGAAEQAASSSRDFASLHPGYRMEPLHAPGRDADISACSTDQQYALGGLTMQDDAPAVRPLAQTSRRRFMASAAATLVAGAAARVPAFAQSPSRTLIKGGVVLSFDRGVGDFEKADVLIE